MERFRESINQRFSSPTARWGQGWGSLNNLCIPEPGTYFETPKFRPCNGLCKSKLMESGENYWSILIWGKVIFGTFSILIKCDMGKFFSKIGKWLTPIIKNKKVTYSKSTLKLWKKRNYAVKLILVESYKESLIILVAKTVNHKSFVKASKRFFTKANASVYSDASSILEPSRLVRKLVPH